MRQDNGYEPNSWSSWAAIFERQDRAEQQRAKDAERIRTHSLKTQTAPQARVDESRKRGQERGRQTLARQRRGLG